MSERVSSQATLVAAPTRRIEQKTGDPAAEKQPQVPGQDLQAVINATWNDWSRQDGRRVALSSKRSGPGGGAERVDGDANYTKKHYD